MAAEAEQTSARARSAGLGTGRLGDLLTLVEDPQPGDSPDDIVATLLAPVAVAMLGVGAARVKPSWTDGATVTGPDGADLHLFERLTDAVQSRDGAALRQWLTGQGVDLAGRAVTDRPTWLAAASHLTGPWEGRRDVHVWTTGLLACALDDATIKQNKEQVAEKHQHPRVLQTKALGLDGGQRLPGAIWLPNNGFTGPEVSGRVKPRITMAAANGQVLQMTATLETAYVESTESFIHALRYLGTPPA